MTDTGGMNVQINDTPISQEDAIGAGVCVEGGGGYAWISMSRRTSSQ